jgi:hypothetical protein
VALIQVSTSENKELGINLASAPCSVLSSPVVLGKKSKRRLAGASSWENVDNLGEGIMVCDLCLQV